MLQLTVYYLSQNSTAVVIVQLSGKELRNLCDVHQSFLLLSLQTMLDNMLKCEISPLSLNLFSCTGLVASKQSLKAVPSLRDAPLKNRSSLQLSLLVPSPLGHKGLFVLYLGLPLNWGPILSHLRL